MLKIVFFLVIGVQFSYSTPCLLDNNLTADLTSCNSSTHEVISIIRAPYIANEILALANTLSRSEFVENATGTFHCFKHQAYDLNCTFSVRHNSSYPASGTSNFCSVYNCSSSLCYCKIGYLNNWTTAVDQHGHDVGTVEEILDLPASLHIDPARVYNPHPRLKYSWEDASSQENQRRRQVIFNPEPSVNIVMHPNPDNATITLSNRLLIVQFPQWSWRNVEIIKGDSRVLLLVNNTQVVYTVTDEFFQLTGWIQVFIWNEGYISQYKAFEVIGVMNCRLHDCLFCYDAVSNWSCLSPYYKFILITVGILLVLSVLGCCSGVLAFTFRLTFTSFLVLFWYIPKGVWGARKSELAESIKGKAKSWFDRLKPKDVDVESASSNLAQKEDSPVGASTASNPPKARSRRVGPSRLFGTTILFGMFSCAISQPVCDSTDIVPAIVTECVPSLAGENCQTRVQMEVDFPHSHYTSCLMLTDPVTSEMVYHASLTYIETVDTISLTEAYYTSAFSPYTTFKYRCPSTEDCTGTMCEDLDSVNDRTAYSQLTNPYATTYPGRSHCDPVVPVFSDHCFHWADPGCMYSGYGLVASGTPGLVLQHQERFQTHFFNFTVVEVKSGLAITSKTFSFSHEEVYESLADLYSPVAFTVEFGAAYSASLPDWTAFPFVLTHGTNVYIGPASLPDFPEPGKIGDIQASDPSQFLSSGVNNFIFNPIQEVSRTSSSKNTHYGFTTSAMLNPALTMSNLYTTKVGGVLYDLGGGNLKGILGGSDPIHIVLSTDSDYFFTRIANIVCPQATLLSVSGCYSCSTPAVALISANSTCQRGAATITADNPNVDVLNDAISLTEVSQNFQINFRTGVKSNSFNLILSSGDYSEYVPVNFQAVENVTVVNVFNQTSGNSTASNTTSSDSVWDKISDFFTDTIPDFFKDIFDGVASWWKYIIFIVIAVGVLVAAYAGLSMVIKFGKARMAMMKKKVN